LNPDFSHTPQKGNLQAHATIQNELNYFIHCGDFHDSHFNCPSNHHVIQVFLLEFERKFTLIGAKI